MTTFRVSVDVEATTVRTTELVIEAESPDEAQEQARIFLQIFPDVTASPDVIKRAVVTKAVTTSPAILTFKAVKAVQMLHPPKILT